MPNHVTNILTIQADKDIVERILQEIKFDEHDPGSIDFNKIIPMPETLHIESGSRSRHGLELYQAYLQECLDAPEGSEDALQKKYREMSPDDPELFSLGKQCYENIREFGYPDWYDWSIGNWGTKWNSYGYDDFAFYEEESTTLRFLTAWSAPEPVMRKLSTMYPDVTFSHRWADEDIGYNVGEREYLNGEVVSDTNLEGGSLEAYEMAAEILQIQLNSEESGFYLSADESGYVYLDTDEAYEVAVLYGGLALLSNKRIKVSEIPKGLVCCEVCVGEDGRTIVHHSRDGAHQVVSLITKGPLELTRETTLKPLGMSLTLLQFLKGDVEQQSQSEGMSLTM